MQAVVRRPKTITATITPPGDKSISHRAAIFNAIADGEARIDNYGPGADCVSTLRILRALGTEIEGDRQAFTVRGGALREPDDVLNAGNSGTTTRLMAGVLAGQSFMSTPRSSADSRRGAGGCAAEGGRFGAGARSGDGSLSENVLRGEDSGCVSFPADEETARFGGSPLFGVANPRGGGKLSTSPD